MAEQSHTAPEKEPERVLGYNEDDGPEGQLRFLIKWKNIEQPEFISQEDAKYICPHLVVQYFLSKAFHEDFLQVLQDNDEQEQ